MKFLDWISRKPKQEDASSTTTTTAAAAAANVADLVSRHKSHQQQKQVLKKSVDAVQSKLLKLNQSFQGTKFDQDPKKQHREIVKIFVNHEEYGLLAIGTLGLSGMEPEIELFEVRPNLLFQSDGRKDGKGERTPSPQLHKDDDDEKKDRNDVDGDGGALVLRKPERKKVFPLDPSSLIGTNLLKRNKLLDRLLHPLNHLSFSSSRSGRSGITDEDHHHDQHHDHQIETKSSKSLSLFKKLVLSGNSTKHITSGGTGKSSKTSSSSSIESRAGSHHTTTTSTSGSSSTNSNSSTNTFTNLKRRSSRAFSCMSVQVDDDESDDDESETDAEAETEAETETDAETEKIVRADHQGQSRPCSSVAASQSSSPSSGCPAACSAPGDPKPGHQPAADAKDIKPEYWIRTDSDYVVLEL